MLRRPYNNEEASRLAFMISGLGPLKCVIAWRVQFYQVACR